MEIRENPLISIVVPIYNVEKYIKDCIESIISQTYKNIEIILVDDGSPDNCGKICDDYKERDDRIVVVHQKNKGLSGARNTGIDIARGRYIGFVDGDDTIEPNMYEVLLKNIQENNAQIAICGRKLIDEQGNVIIKKYSAKEKLLLSGKEAIIEMNSHKSFDMAAWDKLYNIDIWKEIRYPEGKLSEDFFVIYKLFDTAKKVVWTPDPLYRYLLRNNSISRNTVIKQDFVEASKEQMQYISEHYPDIDYIGKTAYVSACLTIYDMYIKKKIKCPNDLVKTYRKNVRKYLHDIAENPYIKMSKKMQAYIFLASPALYNLSFRIFKKITGEQ